MAREMSGLAAVISWSAVFSGSSFCQSVRIAQTLQRKVLFTALITDASVCPATSVHLCQKNGTPTQNRVTNCWITLLPSAFRVNKFLVQTVWWFHTSLMKNSLSRFLFLFHWFYEILPLSWGQAVVQLVEALPFKPEGPGFYSRWRHWSFSLT